MNEVSRPVQFAVPTAAVRATPTNEKEKKRKEKKKAVPTQAMDCSSSSIKVYFQGFTRLNVRGKGSWRVPG